MDCAVQIKCNIFHLCVMYDLRTLGRGAQIGCIVVSRAKGVEPGVSFLLLLLPVLYTDFYK